jgi:hypothetical protein
MTTSPGRSAPATTQKAPIRRYFTPMFSLSSAGTSD